MLRPSNASPGKLWREMHFGWNGKKAIPLFQNTQLLEIRWARLHGNKQISRIFDIVQTKPLKNVWEQKKRTEYMLEIKGNF